MGTPRIDRLERNYAYNSAMEIWQRGTTISGQTAMDADFYVADRWLYRFQASSGSADNTMQRFEDAPAGTPLRYSARIASGGAASATGVEQNIFRQVLEKSDTRRLIATGKMTMTFYYKSNLTGDHAVSLDIQGFTGSNPATQTFNVAVADTWERYTLVFDVSAKTDNDDGSTADNAAGMLINIGPRTGGQGQTTWAVGDNAFLTGVMIVEGDKAADWARKAVTVQAETELCKRYYWRPKNRELFGSGFWPASGIARGSFKFPVEMRVAPALDIINATNMIVSRRGSSNASAGSLAVQTIGVGGIDLDYSTVTGLSIAGDGCVMFNLPDAIAFDSEL